MGCCQSMPKKLDGARKVKKTKKGEQMKKLRRPESMHEEKHGFLRMVQGGRVQKTVIVMLVEEKEKGEIRTVCYGYDDSKEMKQLFRFVTCRTRNTAVRLANGYPKMVEVVTEDDMKIEIGGMMSRGFQIALAGLAPLSKVTGCDIVEYDAELGVTKSLCRPDPPPGATTGTRDGYNLPVVATAPIDVKKEKDEEAPVVKESAEDLEMKAFIAAKDGVMEEKEEPKKKSDEEKKAEEGEKKGSGDEKKGSGDEKKDGGEIKGSDEERKAEKKEEAKIEEKDDMGAIEEDDMKTAMDGGEEEKREDEKK